MVFNTDEKIRNVFYWCWYISSNSNKLHEENTLVKLLVIQLDKIDIIVY